MAATHFSGRVENPLGFTIAPTTGGGAGTAGTWSNWTKVTSAIADATATTVATVNVPNASNSATGRILVRTTITTASHVGDSTRSIEYVFAVTRNAGAVAVLVLSAPIGALIVTVGSGQTITSTLAAAAVSGGATATNTFALKITNTASVAGTSETQVYIDYLNYAGVKGVGALAPPTTGITLS